MNKKQFVSEMNSRLLMRRDLVANFVDFLLHLLAEKIVSGEKIVISGFGRFQLRQRQAKRVMHPARATMFFLPESKFVKFSPAKKLLELINSCDE